MGILENLRKFADNCRHVLSISYKPSSEEFDKSAKLIIIGILLMGLLGFMVAVVISYIITGSLSLI
jgi:protein translocase SEC61 complex gamma subunit